MKFRAILDLAFLISPIAFPGPSRIICSDYFLRHTHTPLLQFGGLRRLVRDDDLLIGYLTTDTLDHLEGSLESRLVNCIEGVVCILEFLICNRRDAALPLFRDCLVTDHDSENPGPARRITVRVLPASRGDLQSLRKISFTVKHAERDIGAIQPGIDIEW